MEGSRSNTIRSTFLKCPELHIMTIYVQLCLNSAKIFTINPITDLGKLQKSKQGCFVKFENLPLYSNFFVIFDSQKKSVKLPCFFANNDCGVDGGNLQKLDLLEFK